MTPEDKQAYDLVLAIFDANQRPGAQPATLFAIARRFLDERAVQERERAAQLLDAMAHGRRHAHNDEHAAALLENAAAAIRSLT